MEPTDQATGVLLVSHNFSKFNDNNKSRIFELARELAADPHLHYESKANAHNAIFVAYHDLDANQRARGPLNSRHQCLIAAHSIAEACSRGTECEFG